MSIRRLGIWVLSVSLTFSLAAWGYSWWSRRAEHWLSGAERCLTLGDYQEVLAWLVLPEATARTRDRALLIRARAMLELGRPSEAVAPLDAIDPNGASATDAAFWKGRTLLAVGQFLRATDWLRSVVALRPDNADAHRWLAAALYELGDSPSALAELREVTRLEPDDARAWRTIGLLLKEAAEPERASQAYLASLRVGPRQPQVHLELAEVLNTMGKYDEAARHLEACSAGVPEGDRLALLAKGVLARGDQSTLQALLNRALGRYPDHVGLLQLRAQVETAEGRTGEAIATLDRVLTLDPDQAASVYQRGLLRKATGDAEGSALDLARASDLSASVAEMSQLNDEAARSPSDAEVRVKIAALCERLGKTDLAAYWYRAALACDPASIAARSGIAALKPRGSFGRR